MLKQMEFSRLSKAKRKKPITQEELEKAKEEFFAKGGTITKIEGCVVNMEGDEEELENQQAIKAHLELSGF